MSRLSKEELQGLLPYCKTEVQESYIKAYIKHGSGGKAAKAVGRSERQLREAIRRVRGYAASKGYIPEMELVRPAPDESSLKLKGASIYRDGIWHKYETDKDKEQASEIIYAVKDAISSYKPLKRIKQPTRNDKELLTVYPMGDPHLGMYAWANETGEDFDCDIAERNLRQAMSYLVSKSPSSETAIILNLGDFFHSDNQSNRTARAGNALDVDTRWSRVLQIGVSLMIDCVNMALEKHKKVIVKNNIGNHDDHTSQVLSVVMSHVFKSNPRVTIAPAEDPFFWYQFGNCMIGSTHGHMVKPKDAAKIASMYQSKMWGDTEHRYFYFGHFHHENRVEDGGIVTEVFNTLASSDAWHHASGYKSKRNMKALVLDKNHGEVERFTYSISRGV